jgi:hypothetical protein
MSKQVMVCILYPKKYIDDALKDAAGGALIFSGIGTPKCMTSL